MGDTLKWPKDTAEIVKRRASEQQDMSRAQAALHLRLQVADDIKTFVEKQFPADTTRAEMLLTLEIFRFYAEQAPLLVGKIEAAIDKAAVLIMFSRQCGKFGGRGGNALMKYEEMFASNPSCLVGYLQRGLVDLVTCWSTHEPAVRKLFVREVLDSAKNYATTLEFNEDVLFGDTKTSIQRWKPPATLSMAAVLKDWLDAEANDSIYTGIAAKKGTRRPNKDQLKDYVQATESREAYHLCWYAIVNAVTIKKNFGKNQNAIIAFFRQNVPAITTAFKAMVPEEDIRNFVQGYLPKLLANPVLPKQADVAATMELSRGELNKFKQGDMQLIAKLSRATDGDALQKIIDESLKGRTFTRRIDDKNYTFDHYDTETKKYQFKLV